ncbi:SCO family protein [Colwellia ponticola]|uniref:SCO family protein n=1 Tax=Colwellia ponticola TaxID=2304625 RepID=A0A8H2PKB2_9GAMM|nr:SCO family protein [Colwellia ponticola]TMM45676.1 SCO family protein [Colwellia ponticola]
MNKKIYGIIALISITAGAVGFHLITQTKQLSTPEYALHYKQARPLPAFTLTDELGQPFNNNQLLDKWSLVFFGYTSCPDVCPTTLQNLNFIYQDLTTIAKNSQVLLISVDPKRDSSEKLKKYINYFNPNFKALRAEHDVLFPFARNLGLMYAITNAESSKNVVTGEEKYWVDHSASLVLINPAGKVAAIFRPEQAIGEVPTINSDNLLSDYKKIVALYQ